jgi:hypothetical protein
MKIRRAGLLLALVTFVSMAWAVLPSSASEKQSPKDKVAVVNGLVITQRDFDREMNGAKRRLASMGKSIKDDQLQILKVQVLENLINLELLYQESQNKGIKIEEVAVNEQLKTIKTKFPNEDDFKKALLNMDLSETDLRFQIGRELAVRLLIDKKFGIMTAIQTILKNLKW